ncbi:hypothetical protein BPAE_0142g00320 [Botrytis paeoniae]|uniref:Uncharacterized protein n=1 Tax=Botrytis paeoniae TaxID=278948 RepID=A0A4Z1FJD2_9HELO|nr:hypothetical protein BPAE_0142g00320 [Botrytis paeoniae]
MNDLPRREVALQKASLFGQTWIVKDILAQEDLDINFCGPETNCLTALHSGSMNGHIYVVRILIDHGAALEVQESRSNPKGFYHLTTFMLTLVNEHMEVAMLLEEAGADANTLDHGGMSALHVAAICSVSMIDYLLHSPIFHQTVSVRSLANITFIMVAVMRGDMDNIEYVLKRSSLSDILARCTSSNCSGYTALHFAVSYNSPRVIIETLVQSGLEMNLETDARNLFRYTSIVDPAAYIQDTALRMFVAKPGINLEPKDAEGRPALVVLCQGLAKSDEPDQRDNWTTLHNSINLLIRRGADVLSQDARGNTALHYICEVASLPHHFGALLILLYESTPILLGSKSSEHYIELFGKPDQPYHPIEHAKTEVICKLIDSIGPIKLTPLPVALAGKNISIIEMLVAHGASANSADVYGTTPIEVARLVYEDDRMIKALDDSPSPVAPLLTIIEKSEETVKTDDHIHIALEEALLRNDINNVEALFQTGCSPKGIFSCGCTLLVTVLHEGLLELANYLIDKGVMIEGSITEFCLPGLSRRCMIVAPTLEFFQSIQGFTSLDLATSLGDSKLVQKILFKSQQSNYHVLRSLHTVALNGRIGCVKSLLHYLAIKDSNKKCLVAEHNMITHPEYFSAPILFASNNIRLRIRHDPTLTASHFAVRGPNDYFRVVNELLIYGADLEARDQYGDTALHCALSKGKLKVSAVLISAGASVNSLSGENHSPIRLTVAYCTPDTGFLLHEFGASLETDIYNREDLLLLAIRRSSPEMVNALMGLGINLNTADHRAIPILFTVLKYLEEEFILELLPEIDVIRHPKLGTMLNQASARVCSAENAKSQKTSRDTFQDNGPKALEETRTPMNANIPMLEWCMSELENTEKAAERENHLSLFEEASSQPWWTEDINTDKD